MPVRFVADHMLGSLARWLRLIGYDTIYPPPPLDEDTITLAQRDDRILLTRDKEITRRKSCRVLTVIVIKNYTLKEQIAEVLSAVFELERSVQLGESEVNAVLSRCSVCNVLLVDAKKEEAMLKVPDGVLQVHNRFWKCEKCGRFYWQGTHYAKIMETIQQITGYARQKSSKNDNADTEDKTSKRNPSETFTKA